ncbi:MAG TPA: hypothetical protein VGC93_17815 [Thermoanaerobaculia bacterium]
MKADATEVVDDRPRRLDETLSPGAEHDSQGPDDREAEGLCAAARGEVVQNGSAARDESCVGEDLQLAPSEIPGPKLRCHRDLRRDPRSGPEPDLVERGRPSRLSTNLLRYGLRHDQLVGERAEEPDPIDLPEQDER